MTERRYTDHEADLILRRAAESEASGLPARRDGLTLSELKEVAREVGIDTGSVEAVAQGFDTSPTFRPHPLLGSPVAPQLERHVRVRVTPEDYPRVVLAIRRAMGRQGLLSTEMDGLEWRARDATGARYVSVRPEGDRTLIRILGNYRDGAMAWFTVGGMTGGMATLVLLKTSGMLAALGLGAAPLVALAAYLPARWLWRRQFRSEEATLRATLEEVTQALEASGREKGSGE